MKLLGIESNVVVLVEIIRQHANEANEDFLCALRNLSDVDFSKQEASGKYVCSICGYVYDPAEHDGVAFGDLPEDWRCPRCKQNKEKFNRA